MPVRSGRSFIWEQHLVLGGHSACGSAESTPLAPVAGQSRCLSSSETQRASSSESHEECISLMQSSNLKVQGLCGC